jgi:hypothetical protein
MTDEDDAIAEAEKIAHDSLRKTANELLAGEMAKPLPADHPGEGFLGCGIFPCCWTKPCRRR